MIQNFIFVDSSYFVFYRFYAILAWCKLAKKEGIENPIENAEFVEKFKKTFIEKLEEIPKKLKIENPIIIVAKDCPRETIWRMKHMPSYKGNRVYNGNIGSFFELAYKEDLFMKGGAQKIIKYPTLEADDCIAIMARGINETFKKVDDYDAHITIITSDMDYLQLASDNIEIYDLKYNKLTEKKSSYNCPKKDLFVKILTGDKSDNIKGVFKKCGPKTACKYYDDEELFRQKLETEGAMERYLLNKKLIDFDEIPIDLVQSFKSNNTF
jgi:5'-3' exonuclease